MVRFIRSLYNSFLNIKHFKKDEMSEVRFWQKFESTSFDFDHK